jgi:hypothetical protein
MRAVAWALVGGLLVIGWFFIIWQNKFHMTAPTVMLCLGYLAVVATVTNLWRVGAAAVAPEDATAEAWARPVGPRDFLEKEKKTLLKAIKEAEFDRDMGKLSQRDADDMIRGYRARAIEVIKEIDLLGQGGLGTVREQILREIRARVQLDAKAAKRGIEAPLARAASQAETGARPDAKPGARPGPKTAAKPDAASTAPASAPEGGTAASAAPDPAASAKPAAETARPVRPRDEELDADSTTALEPGHDEPAKEATP